MGHDPATIIERERERERERRRNNTDLGRKALAVATPRCVEIDEQKIKGRDGSVEIGGGELDHGPVSPEFVLSSCRQGGAEQDRDP
jgi:hypothetical protein